METTKDDAQNNLFLGEQKHLLRRIMKDNAEGLRAIKALRHQLSLMPKTGDMGLGFALGTIAQLDEILTGSQYEIARLFKLFEEQAVEYSEQGGDSDH